jgi:hypothetical protein
MAPTHFRWSVVMVLVLFLLGSCNMPGRSEPTQSGAGFIYTAAAQTVQAQLTEVHQPPATAVSQTPAPPGVSTPTPTVALLTTTPGGSQSSCDLAKFDQDVTYPDNSDVAPGATFVKTWRLQNAGTCTWTPDYSLVFAGGDALGAPASLPLTSGPVAPGDKIDVSVTLKAPDAGGSYRGEWKLRNASNQVFGVGSDGSKPFWVQISVALSNGIVYDFIARASSADWASGAGDSPGSALAFGGPRDNPDGVAMIADRVRLETGATSGKVLLTVPKNVNDGFVSSLFPAYTIQPGDHFKARLGFMALDSSCGSGKVVFRLLYLENGVLSTLNSWNKSCDGKLLPVDVNLTGLKGKTVRFALVVDANGSYNDDWAIWNSALIEH